MCEIFKNEFRVKRKNWVTSKCLKNVPVYQNIDPTAQYRDLVGILLLAKVAGFLSNFEFSDDGPDGTAEHAITTTDIPAT